MIENKLKTVIMGLNEGGKLLLEAAIATGLFQIEAVADKNINLVEKVANELKCEAYDDFRQLISSTDARIPRDNRVLLVAAETHNCDEYIKMATKKKFNCLKLPPIARYFEEAAEFVRLSEEEGVIFSIANTGRYAKGFLGLRDYIIKNQLEQVFLVTVFCTFSEPPADTWHTDPKLSGGGVLLYNCYKIIDQIVLNFGLPQQMYSLNTNQAKDRQQRLYLTEDTAVVTLKFTDTLVGNIITSRRSGIGPQQEYLRFFDKDKILTVNDKQINIRDGSGEVTTLEEFNDTELERMTALLKDFAMSILSPKENKPICTGRENLNNMAVIESAYLSARTGFPEEPSKIINMPSGVTGIQMGFD
ncbi:MAG: Gfo/Idh/MocA family oxidoreductase [Sedimentisphaerales bacterium]|nr:Gfo/Idh/MocA family oxidoreductase [Sedimentisphaerales bacterium]